MSKNHRNLFLLLTIYLFVLNISCDGFSLLKPNTPPKHLFPLSLIHINDFHARFEEMNMMTLECKKNDVCIGGYARIVSTVKQLQRSRTNPLFLNAGDNFSGTMWFTYGKWNVTSYFLNLLKADIMTLGNHEFDLGPQELLHFIDRIQSPIVLANVDLTEEPELEGKFTNSTIIVRGDRQIGIIGVIASDTNINSKTGKIRFLDEVETVRQEADRLDEQGVDIIVVLSHCGIDVDIKIAEIAGSNIDVIVGSHSHTFMYTGTAPGPDTPKHNYPKVITQNNGHKVLIVQASAFAKYVGDLTVYFDASGEAIRWSGQPVFLGPEIKPDEDIVNELEPWKLFFEKESTRVVGELRVYLDNSNCQYEECLMGDFMADAYLSSYRQRNVYSKPTIAFVQTGGIRAGLPIGPISFGDLLTVSPFSNRVDSFDLLGQYVWDAMEFSSSVINDHSTNLKHMLHIAGMKLTVNATKPVGNRVVSIEVLCEDCSPVQYQTIDLNETYRIVAVDFLAHGGNGYSMFAENYQNYEEGVNDADAVAEYFQSRQIVDTVEIERITILT